MRFADIAYHDFQGVVLELEEQESLVRDLGQGCAMVLRNHGLLTAGHTIAEAFNAMHRLELSCKAQLGALACGLPLHPVPDDIVQKTCHGYKRNVRRPFGVLDWPALLRKLDRIDPGYRA